MVGDPPAEIISEGRGDDKTHAHTRRTDLRIVAYELSACFMNSSIYGSIAASARIRAIWGLLSTAGT